MAHSKSHKHSSGPEAIYPKPFFPVLIYQLPEEHFAPLKALEKLSSLAERPGED